MATIMVRRNVDGGVVSVRHWQPGDNPQEPEEERWEGKSWADILRERGADVTAARAAHVERARRRDPERLEQRIAALETRRDEP